MSTPGEVTIPTGHGPSLIYTSPDGQGTSLTLIDRVAVDDPRERAICRALLLYALTLLDQADVNADLGIGPAKEAQR